MEDLEVTASISDILAAANIALPEPAPAAAAYEPTKRLGDQLFISGQLPLREGSLVATGTVGGDVDLASAQDAAAACAAQVLAQAQRAVGDLETIRDLAKITVFVSSAPGFSDQHLVANAASTFFQTTLGDRGNHSRSAIGVAGLPMNAAVEVEAVFELA
jgi:enamine deaminase RidA (YjgF/YER057c/UK114 family)